MERELQRKLLPPPIMDHRIEMATIYQPKRYVSGDFYDYMISEDRQKLTGFVMDFMGHGLSTAIQASAVRVLFHQMMLTITAAGINYFLCNTNEKEPIVKVEGAFLGIMENEIFEQLTIPIHKGDYFLFLSDGFLDGISNEFEQKNQGFQDAIKTLHQMLHLQSGKDDCSAVCVLIK